MLANKFSAWQKRIHEEKAGGSRGARMLPSANRHPSTSRIDRLEIVSIVDRSSFSKQHGFVVGDLGGRPAEIGKCRIIAIARPGDVRARALEPIALLPGSRG